MSLKYEIMQLADQLIRASGYHSFSYADISKPLEVKNAAIHYHFATKADLGLAVSNQTRNNFHIQIKEWAELSPLEQLQAFVNLYMDISQNNLVCFMGALGPAYTSLPDTMKEALTQASDEIRAWVSSVLSKGKADGVFSFQNASQDQADVIITSLLASLILNRVTGEAIVQSTSQLLNNNILA